MTAIGISCCLASVILFMGVMYFATYTTASQIPNDPRYPYLESPSTSELLSYLTMLSAVVGVCGLGFFLRKVLAAMGLSLLAIAGIPVVWLLAPPMVVRTQVPGGTLFVFPDPWWTLLGVWGAVGLVFSVIILYGERLRWRKRTSYAEGRRGPRYG